MIIKMEKYKKQKSEAEKTMQIGIRVGRKNIGDTDFQNVLKELEGCLADIDDCLNDIDGCLNDLDGCLNDLDPNSITNKN